MNIHFIQHDSWVLPGEYLAWAKRHEFGISITKCWQYDPIPEKADADMLVILGGCQCPATTKEECDYFDAESDGCPRQIVRYGKYIYGFQTHMEFTHEIIAAGIEVAGASLENSGRFVQTKEQLLAYDYTEMNAMLASFLDAMVEDYHRCKKTEQGLSE